jgi:Trk K+ transport system NAD-binding subunit
LLASSKYLYATSHDVDIKMADYIAPAREIGFVVNELLDYPRLASLADFADATEELTGAILDEAGKFAAQVLSPLNKVGDQIRLRQPMVSLKPTRCSSITSG